MTPDRSPDREIHAALVAHGPMTMPEIRTRTGVDTFNVTNALSRLQLKGAAKAEPIGLRMKRWSARVD